MDSSIFIISYPKFFDSHKLVLYGPHSHEMIMRFFITPHKQSRMLHNYCTLEEDVLIALFRWMREAGSGDFYKVTLPMLVHSSEEILDLLVYCTNGG